MRRSTKGYVYAVCIYTYRYPFVAARGVALNRIQQIYTSSYTLRYCIHKYLQVYYKVPYGTSCYVWLLAHTCLMLLYKPPIFCVFGADCRGVLLIVGGCCCSPSEDLLRWSWQMQQWLEVHLIKLVGQVPTRPPRSRERKTRCAISGGARSKLRTVFCGLAVLWPDDVRLRVPDHGRPLPARQDQGALQRGGARPMLRIFCLACATRPPWVRGRVNWVGRQRGGTHAQSVVSMHSMASSVCRGGDALDIDSHVDSIITRMGGVGT